LGSIIIVWSKEIELDDDNNPLTLSNPRRNISDVLLDNNGGMYLSGYFGHCMLLAPNLCSNATSNLSYTDRFILKLNTTNGSYSDAKLMGSLAIDEPYNVFLTINRFGLFSASSFSAVTTFGSTLLTSAGGFDAVFMKCN
jgi:hypothetical protein